MGRKMRKFSELKKAEERLSGVNFSSVKKQKY